MNQIPLNITPIAINELKLLFESGKVPDGLLLRIGTKGSGCSGVQYVLGFDKPTEKDLHFNLESVPLIIEKKHLLYLAGITLDFIENNAERGFSFITHA
jgi:iron-sulfur cluster assembly protein